MVLFLVSEAINLRTLILVTSWLLRARLDFIGRFETARDLESYPETLSTLPEPKRE
jgi:hypothetical protein